jgi:hypothetical protein
MAYAYLTFSQARTELANRLGDPSKIYWTDPELKLAIREALRYWNTATLFYRNRFTFNAVANQFWYDLTQQANSPITYTVTDREVISFLLYNLIEAQLSGTWTYQGTDMFTLADIVAAVQRRRDQFLLETGMVTGQSIINGPTSPANRVSLADSVIEVKRAAWIENLTHTYSTLWRTDEWAAESFQSNWATSPENPPSNFSTAVVPPVTLSVIPPPQSTGQIELITTNSGASLNPATGVLLGIPDDFAWVVRMGALADLLGREGQSRDSQRAQYAEARWKEGIALAKQFTSILTGYLNGVQVFPQAIHSLSCFRSGWQSEAPGTPDTLGVMSWNLMALAPLPISNIFSIMLDMVQNAPVPVNDGDFVQIGREDLDALLDMAQHLVAFKEGGQEFMETVPLYQSAVAQAKLRNGKLQDQIPFYAELDDRATLQEAESVGIKNQPQ